MKTKNLLVSFVTLATIVLLATTLVSAKDSITTDPVKVYIRGDLVSYFGNEVISVTEGETIPIRVVFNSDVTDSDVKVEAKIDGYNDLDDLYITATIPTLGVERRSYFGDLVALECGEDDNSLDNYGVGGLTRKCNEDDSEVASGRLYLQIPEDVKPGAYTIDVEATSEDASASDTAQITVQNDFLGENVISTVTSRTVAAGEDAEYSILIVNPSSKLRVYRIVPETSSDLTVSVSESVVAVPAGSSKTVSIKASSDTEGTYNFKVSVLSGEELVGQTALSTKVEGKTSTTPTTNPIIVLTVVLAIIFVVLLIVLLVLIGKKPEKSEEFGESYY